VLAEVERRDRKRAPHDLRAFAEAARVRNVVRVERQLNLAASVTLQRQRRRVGRDVALHDRHVPRCVVGRAADGRPRRDAVRRSAADAVVIAIDAEPAVRVDDRLAADRHRLRVARGGDTGAAVERDRVLRELKIESAVDEDAGAAVRARRGTD
jgi:hypothetical protein